MSTDINVKYEEPKLIMPEATAVMRVGVYIRVSTEDQLKGYSMDAQRDIIIKFCETHNLEIVEIYEEKGVSASKVKLKDRPMGKKVVEDMQNGIINGLVVFKLDRFVRNTRDSLWFVEEILIPTKSNLYSVNDPINLDSPMGKVMFTMTSSMGQLESETISTRVKASKEQQAGL